MESWLHVLAESFSPYMFGGYEFEQENEWRVLLGWFWDVYRRCNPHHPVFSLEGVDLTAAIPYMLHGDEGRGLRSLAFMVESWQFVLSHLGPAFTNISGCLGFLSLVKLYFLKAGASN